MFFKRKKIDFREMILKLSSCLEIVEENLHRIKRHVDSMYIDYLTAYVLGDYYRSTMYIAEISEAEYMTRLIFGVCLALERAIIRLTVFSEFYEVFSTGFSIDETENLRNIVSLTLNFSSLSINDVCSFSEDFLALTVFNLNEYELGSEASDIKTLAENVARHLMETPLLCFKL